MASTQREQWPEFLTVAEVADIMRVSKMTVYRLLHNGEIVSNRVGRSFRVQASSLRAYLQSNPGYDVELPGVPESASTADLVAQIDRDLSRR